MQTVIMQIVYCSFQSESISLHKRFKDNMTVSYEEIRKVRCKKTRSNKQSIMTFGFKKKLSAEQAKQKVFEVWDDLNAFSRRRFPGNENQANQALDYALNQLQANDWKRVREWQGQGRFLTFILTLLSRLLTDYTRKQSGHHRPPKWITDQSEQIWNKAYKILIVEQYTRNEAIEMLKIHYPNNTSTEEVVAMILEKCRPKSQQPKFVSIENTVDQGTSQSEPDKQLMMSTAALLEILLQYLNSEDGHQLPSYLEAPFLKLKSLLKLSDEDRMLLYLRYVEGISMNNIVKLLKLKGDPYKRHNKLIKKLQLACQQADLSPQEDLLDDGEKL